MVGEEEQRGEVQKLKDAPGLQREAQLLASAGAATVDGHLEGRVGHVSWVWQPREGRGRTRPFEEGGEQEVHLLLALNGETPKERPLGRMTWQGKGVGRLSCGAGAQGSPGADPERTTVGGRFQRSRAQGRWQRQRMMCQSSRADLGPPKRRDTPSLLALVDTDHLLSQGLQLVETFPLSYPEREEKKGWRGEERRRMWC